jgi:hypothetical protein
MSTRTPSAASRHLQHLQDSLGTERLETDRFLRLGRQRVKGLSALAGGGLKSFHEHQRWLRKELADPFVATLPAADREVLSHVIIGLFPTHDPNAWALRTPEGADLVVLHYELLAVLGFYSELKQVVLRMDQGANPEGTENLELLVKAASKGLRTDAADLGIATRYETSPEAQRIAEEGIGLIVDSFAGRELRTTPELPLDISERDLDVVFLKACSGELFVLAHEFAHVALGHTAALQESTIELNTKRMMVKRFNWQQRQELEADAKAFAWIAGLRGRETSNPVLAFAGLAPSLCAEFLMLVHFVELGIGRPGPDSSHPPAAERLRYLYRSFSSTLQPYDAWNIRMMIQRMAADV